MDAEVTAGRVREEGGEEGREGELAGAWGRRRAGATRAARAEEAERTR
jgi:hypothetical protein